MKTLYPTSYGQLEGYLGGFATPGTLRVVRGYRSSPLAGYIRLPGGASTGYRSPTAVASDGEPGYSQLVRCLVLFSLLLTARVVAGLPPAAASNPALEAVEGYYARQAPSALPEATTTQWVLPTTPPGSENSEPLYASARAGPTPLVAIYPPIKANSVARTTSH